MWAVMSILVQASIVFITIRNVEYFFKAAMCGVQQEVLVCYTCSDKKL
jgi:hypothetical protein